MRTLQMKTIPRDFTKLLSMNPTSKPATTTTAPRLFVFITLVKGSTSMRFAAHNLVMVGPIQRTKSDSEIDAAQGCAVNCLRQATQSMPMLCTGKNEHVAVDAHHVQ
uniref:Uncharacterized protein n=1 Tax=Physcomitrium patens TaxID=3218 RepID=A0A2K1IC07_PHYPA|nr:hypothetical protein PHYPA_030283 [Physcomitrium patens]PNR26811.1 hypothetical protein PHYPA_030292 [Physcomitrium patens]